MKIKELFTNNKIWNYLYINGFSELFTEWGLSEDDINYIDYDYMNNWSGDKSLSPLVNNLVDNGFSMSEILNTVSSIIQTRYKTKWTKLHNTITAEYEATHPYLMTTHEENTGTVDRLRNTTGNDKRTPNLTDTELNEGTVSNTGTVNNNTSSNSNNSENSNETVDTTGTENLNTENGIYGFNSLNAVGADNAVSANSNNSTRTSEENVTNISSDTTTTDTTNSNTETSNTTNTITHTGVEQTEKSGSEVVDEDTTGKRDLTTTGNMGNKTMQELLDEERNYWMWQFFNVAFNDVDYVIAGGCYDEQYR